ncbi:alcohol dehydrogenase catalytic domain-containing protein [Streptomyces flavovirens]|uniref:Alcohol dehydrogenase catalytic domain-containing protein n=1 Tax=Streptomyces flavovirens TaxID=52258 RepID=A0ABV8MXB6_9ACTN|nr:alcohol dehydrogenase catalytic domain-containing protein [Streptomyces sp. MBT51]MBK3594451.1 alcohol dehydrogenase catalytic domain-containing protein [Streptomyces sp. MBT51]
MEAVFPTRLPAVPGGEIAGVVDAVGEDVDHLKVGGRGPGLVRHRLLRPVRPGTRGRPRAQAGRTGPMPPPCPWRVTAPNACWTCSPSPRVRRC